MPRPLPVTDKTPLVRTDFSDQARWELVLTQIEQPGWLDPGQRWVVSPIEDREYEGLDKQELVELAAPLFEQDEHAALLVVDETTITAPEHPVLIIELEDTSVGEATEAESEGTRSFRARACAVAE